MSSNLLFLPHQEMESTSPSLDLEHVFGTASTNRTHESRALIKSQVQVIKGDKSEKLCFVPSLETTPSEP